MLKRIAQLAIRSTLSLASVRPTFFSTARSSALPEAADNPAAPKKKLSHQAQSAIWAERVIQYILNAQPLTNINSYSLKEQIIKLQNPDNVHQFELEPKEKVMQLFTQGVLLNDFVFDQNRIQQAKQEFQQGYNDENSFIFCPNLLVTKEIFKYMMKLKSNFLVTGGFGISKTVSVILFIQLSNHVNSYLFKAAQSQQNNYKEELLYLRSVLVNPSFFDQQTKDKQLEHPGIQLPKKKTYFSRTIPRYWYWSISSEALEVQQQLRQTLLLQAPQISLQKKKKLRSIENFREFVRQLKKCYPQFQSYSMKVVVDQFNAVASRARQWNKKVDQYKQMKQETINLNQYKKDEKIFKQRAQRNIDLVKSVIYLSNLNRPSYILNSSTSIQRDILESPKGKQSLKVYFDIQTDHNNYKIRQVRYLQELKKSLIDFLHNFWFEIERKLKIRNKDNKVKEEKNIKKAIQEMKDNAIIQEMKAKLTRQEKENNEAIPKMRQKFFEEVKDKKVNYFSRFLFVREYLTEQKIEQIQKKYKLFKDNEKDKLKGQNPFKGIYESFTAESKMKYRQKVRQFFLKVQTDRSLALLFTIYDIAVLQSYKSEEKDKELTASVKDLTSRLLKNPFEWLNQDAYKGIIPFTLTQDQEFIKFFWKPEQFTSTVEDILFSIQGQPFNLHFIRSLKQYRSHRGIFFEHCVIQSLIRGAVVTFRSKTHPQLNELKFEINSGYFTTFQSFNQAYFGNHDFEIVLKANVEANKDIYKEKKKLSPKEAAEYINQFNQKQLKSQQIPVDSDLYDVYQIRASTISKNLSDLLDMCDKHPYKFFIATPYHKQKFDSRSECIDFIIARKYQDKYQIYTFDVSISRKTAKLQKAQKFFNQILKKQSGNGKYKINHIILCHSEAERPVLYDSRKQLNFIYSPWQEMNFESSKHKQALVAFKRMVEINNMLNEIEEDEE